MNPRADWFAWALHFLGGLIAGSFFSFLFLRGGRRSIPIITSEAFPVFLIGLALLGAGLASRYGDRLWVGDSYRVIPPNEPRQSSVSCWTSFVTVCIGVIIIIIALGKSFCWWL